MGQSEASNGSAPALSPPAPTILLSVQQPEQGLSNREAPVPPPDSREGVSVSSLADRSLDIKVEHATMADTTKNDVAPMTSSLAETIEASLTAMRKRQRDLGEESTGNGDGQGHHKRARFDNRVAATPTSPTQARPALEPKGDPPSSAPFSSSIPTADHPIPSIESSVVGQEIEAMLKSALGSITGVQRPVSPSAPAPVLEPAPEPVPEPTQHRTSDLDPEPSTTRPQTITAVPIATAPPIPLSTTAVQAAIVPSSPRKSSVGPLDKHTAFFRDQKRMRFYRHAAYITRSMGLPLLGSLSVQVLFALSEHDTLASVRACGIDPAPNTPPHVLRLLLATFCSTRQLFTETSLFLMSEELDIKELGDQETIQVANMATICASLLVSDDVPLIDVHDHFLMTFLPESGILSSDLGTLFLNLKLLTLVNQIQQTPDGIGSFLEQLFPVDLEDQLIQLHPDMPLEATELQFLKDMMTTKDQLLAAVQSEERRQDLVNNYPIDSFRSDLTTYLRRNSKFITHFAESHDIEVPAIDDFGEESDSDSESCTTSTDQQSSEDKVAASIASMLEKALASSGAISNTTHELPNVNNSTATASSSEPATVSSFPQPSVEGLNQFIQDALQKSAAAAQTGQLPQAHPTTEPEKQDDRATVSSASGEPNITGLAMLIKQRLSQKAQGAQSAPSSSQSPVAAANAALSSMQNTYATQLALYKSRTPSSGGPDAQKLPQQQQQQLQQPQRSQKMVHPPKTSHRSNINLASLTLPGPNDALPPNQSSPSSVLYQRARQAAMVKMTAYTRREGLHSSRRPWSAEEEQALMTGLDMVKGPHWSHILQLFGTNGTISDILKDRSQVQLKDKARNLKLFFLKANSEMPYYLKCVTGELKTRAPSQAARKEAEERARSNNEEEQARVQGIMTLAGGLQNKGQQKMSAVAATGGAQSTTAQQQKQPRQLQKKQPQQQPPQMSPKQISSKSPAATAASGKPPMVTSGAGAFAQLGAKVTARYAAATSGKPPGMPSLLPATGAAGQQRVLLNSQETTGGSPATPATQALQNLQQLHQLQQLQKLHQTAVQSKSQLATPASVRATAQSFKSVAASSGTPAPLKKEDLLWRLQQHLQKNPVSIAATARAIPQTAATPKPVVLAASASPAPAPATALPAAATTPPAPAEQSSTPAAIRPEDPKSHTPTLVAAAPPKVNTAPSSSATSTSAYAPAPKPSPVPAEMVVAASTPTAAAPASAASPAPVIPSPAVLKPEETPEEAIMRRLKVALPTALR